MKIIATVVLLFILSVSAFAGEFNGWKNNYNTARDIFNIENGGNLGAGGLTAWVFHYGLHRQFGLGHKASQISSVILSDGLGYVYQRYWEGTRPGRQASVMAMGSWFLGSAMSSLIFTSERRTGQASIEPFEQGAKLTLTVNW